MVSRLHAYSYGLIFLFLFSVTLRLLPGPRTIDDSYITYRYAHNIISGSGFTYNSTEKVLGTTTPLYTLFLSGVGKVWSLLSQNDQVPFPVISWVANAIIDGLCCLILVPLGKKICNSIIGWISGFLWAIAPYSVTFSIGGLETSLYISLICFSTLCFLEKKPGECALFASLALLTRPDALIFIVLLFGGMFYQILIKKDPFIKHRIPHITTLFLLPAIIWFGYATIYFGSPIPHSVLAKSLAYRLDQHAAFVRFIQHYSTPFFEQNWAGSIGIIIGIFIYPFLFLVGAIKAFQISRLTLVAAIYPWLYLLVFSIPNPLIFRWYLSPPLPFLFIFILVGIWKIANQLVESIIIKMRLMNFVCTILLIIPLAYPFLSTATEWKFNTNHYNNLPTPDMAFIDLENQYSEAALIVKPLIKSPNFTIAAGDVGVLGYFTGAKILDTVGLISPISSAYYPLNPSAYVINYAISSDLILDQLPDAVIMLEVYGRNTLLQDTRFLSSYTLYKKIQSSMYGSDGLLIFLRNLK